MAWLYVGLPLAAQLVIWTTFLVGVFTPPEYADVDQAMDIAYEIAQDPDDDFWEHLARQMGEEVE